MALEAARDGSEPLEKYRLRSQEHVELSHSPRRKERQMVPEWGRRKPDGEGDYKRSETRGKLIAYHWRLAANGVFGSKYAAQVVHSYMCLNPMSNMPKDHGRCDKWRPPVPGAQAIAKATCMDISNVRKRMKDLADMKLIDISDGYEHPRLRSFDEDSDYDRRQELARLRGWPQSSGKRTAVVTADMVKRTQVVEEDPVLRERAG